MADWKDLLPEVLALTSKRLTLVSDYISFRGVCKSWRSAATFDNFNSGFPQVPWLMFEELLVDKFFILSINKQLKQLKTLDLSREIKGWIKQYYLSCKGWLLCIAENDVSLYLWHPVKPDRIQIPNWDTFPGSTINNYQRGIIRKMVLSGSPTIVSDLVIMVIWGAKKQLGFSRPGDSCWTLMEYWDGSFKDIIYHKGKLYAIDNNGRVVECDIHGQTPTQIRIMQSIPSLYGIHSCCYIVESSEKLLIFHLPCEVYEFDVMESSYKKIYDLGNKSLFVSCDSSTFCVEGFAWNDEIQPNCIYDGATYRCFELGNIKKSSKVIFCPKSPLHNWFNRRGCF